MDLLTYLMAKRKKKIFPHKSDLLAYLLSRSTYKYFYQTFTGTTLSVNNTANAPMKIMLNASEMSQSGTPTPESPQDIHIISGDNTLMVEGKNLWNENAQVFTNQALLSNPTKDSNNVWTFTSSGSGYAFAISKKTLQAGTYTFSFNCVGGNAIVLNGSTTINNTFTLNGETEITIRVFKSGAVEGDVIKLSNVMIEKGSTTTPYEPYVSQEADINLVDIEYCKIGNYEDEFIRTSGLNLFDISKFKQGTWNNSTPNARVVGFLKKVKNGESYIVTLNNSNYNFAIGNSTSTNQDNNTAVQSDSGWQASTYTYNITGDGYLWLQIKKSSGNISPSELLATDFMLNEGTTALPYEPYGSNEWYIKKNIGKVVLDGSENWAYGGVTSIFYTTSITDYAISNNIPYSNYYKGVDNVTGAANM